MNWLEFDELVNARDLGGTPCVDGGRILPRRLLRSDNLQDLSDADVERIRQLGVSDVIDLRAASEVALTGPGPLTGLSEITVHHLDYHREATDGPGTRENAASLVDRVVPWLEVRSDSSTPSPGSRVAAHYLSYLRDRPENVVAALRVVAAAPGATLVHCAAGRDRTGTTVALALALVGADRDAIMADYSATGERMQQIVDRLMRSELYRPRLEGRTVSAELTDPANMVRFLEHLDTAGGVETALAEWGWSPQDTAALRAKLRD